MASPIILPFDDKDLDDAALWAVIDSAAASYSTSLTITPSPSFNSRKIQTLKPSNRPPYSPLSPPPHLHKSSSKSPSYSGFDRPHKIPRSSSYCVSEVTSEISPLAIARHTPAMRSPVTPVFNSPGSGRLTGKEISPFSENLKPMEELEAGKGIGAGGRVINTVNLFKEYQDTAMAILEKSDYIMISGNPYIKKSGWRKMAFFFNVSFEIKDKIIDFDESRNVQRAEFLVRAHMPSGRFSDGWGSCEKREKRFMKPNSDIPSTAETRAKNKACQDLLGIGEYRPSAARKP